MKLASLGWQYTLEPRMRKRQEDTNKAKQRRQCHGKALKFGLCLVSDRVFQICDLTFDSSLPYQRYTLTGQ